MFITSPQSSALVALACCAPRMTMRTLSPAMTLEGGLSRRTAVHAALLAATLGDAAAFAADELDDEVPDIRIGSGAPKRTKPSERAKSRQVTDADVRAAYENVVELRAGLNKVDKLCARSDLASVGTLLSEPPFSSLGESLAALVQAPELGPDEKKAIGTVKTYGLGADALIMVGGLTDAVREGDANAARGFVQKAAATLDEIVINCKALS